MSALRELQLNELDQVSGGFDDFCGTAWPRHIPIPMPIDEIANLTNPGANTLPPIQGRP